MTDRELLELAAKAAGVDAEWDDPDEADLCVRREGMFLKGKRSPDNSKYWNPLTDDGDALRLAVKLRFHIKVFDAWSDCELEAPGFAEIWRENDDDPIATEYVVGDDYEAATRSAIVFAAAEIGKAMP